MAAINGWWFIGVGALVTIVSSLQEGMLFFIIIGCIFMAYGVLKIILEKFQKNEQHIVKRYVPEEKKTYYCSNCGRILDPADNFCPNCGMLLR